MLPGGAGPAHGQLVDAGRRIDGQQAEVGAGIGGQRCAIGQRHAPSRIIQAREPQGLLVERRDGHTDGVGTCLADADLRLARRLILRRRSIVAALGPAREELVTPTQPQGAAHVLEAGDVRQRNPVPRTRKYPRLPERWAVGEDDRGDHRERANGLVAAAWEAQYDTTGEEGEESV